MENVKRGEIYYISRGGLTVGHEQHADRPGIVVSNDENNQYSGTVEVVYLTTQPKREIPTHVIITSSGRTSTALCEQVNTVSTERLVSYIGIATDEEMHKIDMALAVSLSICDDVKSGKIYREEIRQLKEELQITRENNESEKKEEESRVAKISAERDTYKSMYEHILSCLIPKMQGGNG